LIAENLAEVRERISQATKKSGRDPDSVRLVVVSKQVDIARGSSRRAMAFLAWPYREPARTEPVEAGGSNAFA